MPHTHRLGKMYLCIYIVRCIHRCQSIAAARIAAFLRAEAIAIAVASFIVEGLADALVEVPACNDLGLILPATEVALVAAHIAVDIV